MSFRSDSGELRQLIKKHMDAGHGRQSLELATKEFQSIQEARAITAPEPKPSRRHGRTFLISALFGAIWQDTRR